MGRREDRAALAARTTVAIPAANVIRDEDGKVVGVKPNHVQRRRDAAAARKVAREAKKKEKPMVLFPSGPACRSLYDEMPGGHPVDGSEGMNVAK